MVTKENLKSFTPENLLPNTFIVFGRLIVWERQTSKKGGIKC